MGKGQLSITRSLTSGTFQPLNTIPHDVLMEILTLAAPHFGFAAEDFIRMYESCGCISVTQIGPGVYLVIYGGIGIQIVIDGCRIEDGMPGTLETGNKKR